MAEYEPFPTGSGEIQTDRDLTKKVLGCFGLGGLGIGAAIVAAMVLIGALGSLASGCDLEIGSPGKGTSSARLAVAVTPRTELAAEPTVRVTSDAFEPDHIVGVAVCLRSADTERRGVEACDEDQGARFATDPEGRLDATFAVPRVITVGGRAYDCAASTERCLVVAADANDYDRSGGQTISFRAGLPAADLVPVAGRAVSDHLPIGADPSVEGTAVAPGTELRVLASGFQPGEPLLIAYCTAALDEDGVVETCEPTDGSAAVAAVAFRTIDADLPRADASGGFTTTLPAQATVLPYGSDLSGADLATTTAGPGATTTTSARLREGEVRCTEAAGGCRIVIAAAADTKRSAVLPYAVTS